MAPISKVTLSVAVQQNKELEKQQAAIQQVSTCYPALEANWTRQEGFWKQAVPV